VLQPPVMGHDYPFVLPSHDIEFLFGDFYLSYEDLDCQRTLPFRLDWAYGFGINQVPPLPGKPTPTNPHDVRIVDAHNNVVFDSTLQGTKYKEVEWAKGRLIICQWEQGYEICRATYFTGWTIAEIINQIARNYNNHISPERGELDPRTLNQLPKRLRSIKIKDSDYRFDETVEFHSGYNLEVQTGESFSVPRIPREDGTVEGRRQTTRVVFTAQGGLGLGLATDCSDIATFITNINGVRPDTTGNFTLDAGDCLRLKRPVALAKSEPREMSYFSMSKLIDAADAKCRALHANEPELCNAAQHSISMWNDCVPCCDCDYYEWTYEGIRRQWNQWWNLARDVEDTRDIHADNINRWNAAYKFWVEHPLQTVIMPEGECKLIVGGSYKNTTNECISPLTLQFTIQLFIGGGLTGVAGVSCDHVMVEGPGTPVGGQPQSLSGWFPTFSTTFDTLKPLDVAKCSFRLCIPYCGDMPGLTARLQLSALFNKLVLDVDKPTLAPVPTPVRIDKFSNAVLVRSEKLHCHMCKCPVNRTDV